MRRYTEGMNQSEFREALLGVMERKKHWAWKQFTDGTVKKDALALHFEQEYAVFVRDFPVLVGWGFVQCPIASVRRDLAENIYEEETGGIIAGRPHPELFLEYARGLGMDLARFEHVELIPAARAYREALDDITQRRGWACAVAVMTIFVEGTEHERGEIEPGAPRRPVPPLDQHPLVVHYGLPVEALALTKAHRTVEGDHRAAAWRSVLDHVPEDERQRVVDAMTHALDTWLAYRDAVALACACRR